ncbi:MAG: VWA domain-containing protein [Pseudomonadales bacterium]|nr:VWA domain-containing protein [Pseudomonadales bacterium]MCP5331619.1 VWA domain-containing protein [Pseudomonadales bacterium]MCP5344750.1 VWA domain-containing protein [Pseudomonadales bacterium]
MLEFTWPWAFLALPVPLLVYRLLSRAARQDAALFVPFYRRLSSLHTDSVRSDARRLIKWLCCVLIWIALVVASSRPQWVGEAIQLPSNGRDLMLAVDVSGSMEARDMVINNSQLSRFEVMKVVVSDFAERREGDRLGLILFAAHAYIQTPLTFDRNTVATLISELEIGMIEESATAIGDAIGLAVKHLRERPENSRVLVLLTDGVNNAGAISPAQAGQLAQTEGIKIYTIGMGADSLVQRSFQGSRAINPSAELDEENLTMIAETTGGRYFRARNVEDLVDIYAELDTLETIEQDEQTFRPISVLFYWPLGIAVLLSFLLALLSLPWSALFGRRANVASDTLTDNTATAGGR